MTYLRSLRSWKFYFSNRYIIFTAKRPTKGHGNLVFLTGTLYIFTAKRPTRGRGNLVFLTGTLSSQLRDLPKGKFMQLRCHHYYKFGSGNEAVKIDRDIYQDRLMREFLCEIIPCTDFWPWDSSPYKKMLVSVRLS